MPSGHWAVPFRMFGLTENGKRNAATGRFFVRWLLYAGKARQWTGGRLPSGGNAAGMRYGRRVPAGKARHPAGGLAGAGPRTGDAVEWEGRPPSGRLYAGAVLGRHGAMCLDGAGGARAVKRPPSCRALAGAGVCAGRRAAGVGKQAFRGCAWGLATCNVLAWGTRAPKTGRLLLGVRAGDRYGHGKCAFFRAAHGAWRHAMCWRGGTRALKIGRLLLGARAGVSLRAWEMCIFQGRAWGLACIGGCVCLDGTGGARVLKTSLMPRLQGRHPRGAYACAHRGCAFSGKCAGLAGGPCVWTAREAGRTMWCADTRRRSRAVWHAAGGMGRALPSPAGFSGRLGRLRRSPRPSGMWPSPGSRHR